MSEQRPSNSLLPCPFCGGSARMATEHDSDSMTWHYVTCRGCGARSRGNWHSPGNDCPLHRAEVRDGWNRRATAEPPDALRSVQTMFRAAVSSLAEISQALDIPDHVASVANGNAEILKAIAHLKRASSPPLDARYCPFNHKPCEPIDLAEETSETKSETVMSKVREHFDAQRDRDGYHSELERLEFAPPADPGPVQTFEPNGPERGFATMCANCGQTFGKHIAQDHSGNSSVCPAPETSGARDE